MSNKKKDSFLAKLIIYKVTGKARNPPDTSVFSFIKWVVRIEDLTQGLCLWNVTKCFIFLASLPRFENPPFVT